jgi:hypothetical protein
MSEQRRLEIEKEAEAWVNDGTFGYPGDEPGEFMFRELKKAYISGREEAEKEIERLKGLIEKAFNNNSVSWKEFKIKHNL